MFENFAKWTRLDRVRLTYPSLIKMTVFMLGCFVGLAWLNMNSDAGRTVHEIAERRYELRGFAEGEKYLVEHLEKNPKDERAWIMLARKRGLVDAVIAGGGFGSRKTGPGLRKPADFYRPHLAPKDFNAFLKRSPRIPVIVLSAWRKSRADYAGALRLLTGGNRRDPALLNGAGRISFASKKFEDASRYFKTAASLQPKEPDHRLRLLRSLIRLRYLDELSTLMEQPEYRAAADDPILRDYYIHQGEYLNALAPLVRWESSRYRVRLVAAALLSGIGWFLFCLHMGRFLQLTEGRTKFLVLSLAALALGGLSTYPTLWLVVIEDHLLDHAARDADFIYNLLYNILGIGLREEAMKLLLLLPLVPFLMRTKDRAVLLTIPSLVGLGFAVEENIAYFNLSRGAAVAARFLTANFFHLALTGFAGFHLIRAFRGEKEGWKEFGEAFGLATVCHGAYDFLLTEPSLRELSFLSYTVYIWLSWQFLALMSQATMGGRRRVSLTRVFIIALLTAVGINYILLVEWLGFWQGFLTTVGGLLGVIIISVMFFREFNEPISWK